jgi:hypothetical protein
MSGTIEARNVSISNYLPFDYRFRLYFTDNSSGIFYDTTIEKYVIAIFPMSHDIRGSISFYNCRLERAALSWIHSVNVDNSSIDSLEIIRGGFSGLAPLIHIEYSNVSYLNIGDFGGLLEGNQALLGNFVFGGSLYMWGNISFIPGSTVFGGRIIRNFNVLVQDDHGDPIPDSSLVLHGEDDEIVWNGKTNRAGQASFNVTFTSNNISYYSWLEASDFGESVDFKEVRFKTATPIVFIAQNRVRLKGDVNNDGMIDIRDVSEAVLAFNSFTGTTRWNPFADVDDSGRVDMKDIVAIVLNFGKHG